MARTVTWNELRSLAAVEAKSGCAISLYLNLDPSLVPTEADAETRLNSLLDEAAKSEHAAQDGLTHDQRQGLRADFQRIRSYFDEEFVRDGSRGLAIFCAGLDRIWSTIALPDAVGDDVRVDRRLYLAPLASLVGRGTGAIVLAVSREQGRFYRMQAGRLEEDADLSDEQPRRHDQGGWSQSRFQRHVDELAAEHLRSVADELDRFVRQANGDLEVVIVAPEDSRAELANHLSAEVRAALAGWATAEAHAGASELLQVALPVLEERRAERERELLDRWREGAGRNARSASGWEETLAAASDARVDTLLAAESASRQAWRCPKCGRAGADAGECPLDGTPMERVEKGIDVAVHQTLLHGGTIHVVRHARDLDPVGGLGAILRF